MSTTKTTSKKIDQKEYLKKYLSGDKDKKKKKKSKKHKRETVKIIDDDCAGRVEEIDEELLLAGDDAPQIVGEYIEEGLAGSSTAKWRSITVKEESPDSKSHAAVKEEREQDLWGRKASTIKIKRESSPSRRGARAAKARQITPDISPPRKRKTSASPNNRNCNKYTRSRSRDISPPRRSKNTDYSPQRSKYGEHRKREDVATRNRDRSHDRRGQNLSPTLRSRKNSDNSPPRKNRQLTYRSRSRDQSPQRKPRKNYDSNTDYSKRQNGSGSRIQSPPSRLHKDQSQLKRRDSDNSPPRRRLPDSPRRVNIKKESVSPPPARRSRWNKNESIERSLSPPPTHKPKSSNTLDGKKAGLQSAQSLKAETEERRREETRMFAKMSTDLSGRDAEVQVRSTGRRGKRAREAADEDPEVRRRKEEHELKKKQIYDRWGKGLKQIEEHEARRAEQEHESNKPLARYADDEDLDSHLREQERPEDPMLEYMRQKNKERQKEAKVPTVPVYEGSYPENRFGIRPGYRWDGVNRSNGYEKKWFDVQNEKRAMQDEAYKYSVEDM